MRTTARTLRGLFLLAGLSLAAPAFASPSSMPQCGDEKGKDEKKPDTSATPQCGDEKGKDEKKPDTSATPQCGDEKGKDEKKPDSSLI